MRIERSLATEVMLDRPYLLRMSIPAIASNTSFLIQKVATYPYYELADNDRFRIEWNRDSEGTACKCRDESPDIPKIELK
jgi:hypothetical protein